MKFITANNSNNQNPALRIAKERAEIKALKTMIKSKWLMQTSLKKIKKAEENLVLASLTSTIC